MYYFIFADQQIIKSNNKRISFLIRNMYANHLIFFRFCSFLKIFFCLALQP